MKPLDNPFYYNYVFQLSDLQRQTIHRWQYPFLWMLTTYTQISFGYVWHYKRFNGKIYLIKCEDLHDNP